MILAITAISEADWPALRRQLEAAALVEAEDLPGVTVPFLRFHPTLAPMLWAQAGPEEQERLGRAHRQGYYGLAGSMYFADDRTPNQIRAIARRELPNLLHAVHAALAEGDPDGVAFANRVALFLDYFDLPRERAALAGRAQAAAGEVGSTSWYLARSNQGEQLLAAGRVQEAAEVFGEVLRGLGEAPSYERAQTLVRLGRCYEAGGRPDLAEREYRNGLAVLDRLEPSDGVRRQRGNTLTDLADVLRAQGPYAEAHEVYQEGLAISESLGDLRSQGVSLIQIGTLAMVQGNLKEAAERYQDALGRFQQLGEPATEAIAWHQLGMVFQKARQWDEAERHYREAARLDELLGNLAGAAGTWNQLAVVNAGAGKPGAAETWYRKAIDVLQGGDRARAISNLANLLRSQPGRLTEARQLAEDALAIKKTLEPGAAEIWTTYSILADLSDQEHQPDQAREYRRLARETKRNFAGTRYELRRHAGLIVGTLLATQDASRRAMLEQNLPGLDERGWTNLVAVIRRILAGERDADALCDPLDLIDSMIVEAILAGLADPASIQDLLPEDAG